MTKKSLLLQGVKENNLKNITLEIPHDSLVCVTGLSGSGKSSLAFDTVYAEGQRRYIETFSPYTRQFLDKIKKPDTDRVANVRPAIAIQQKTRILNSRSTVGSLTNLNDYLRTLWSHIALPTCPICNSRLESFTSAELTKHAEDTSAANPDETYFVCAEIVLPQKKKERHVLREHLATIGYSRFLDPASLRPVLHEPEELPTEWQTDVVVVVIDRFSAARFVARTVQDSIAQAYSLGRGACALIPQSLLQQATQPFPLADQTFFQQLRCKKHTDVLVPRMRKSLFSYNHPNGACETCNGFGHILQVDEPLCVPNPALSIVDGALHCWRSETRAHEEAKLISFCKKQGISVTTPWFKLSPAERGLIFDTKEKGYTGVRPWFKRLERKSYKMHVRVFLAKYRSQVTCPACDGKRLKPEALQYRYADVTLPHLWELEIEQLHKWLLKTHSDLSGTLKLPRALDDLFNDTVYRLRFLLDLGLPYLTMNRQARTLSGGETQRVNLAAALGSNLTSTHFVLDEPSVGLHARDTRRLIAAVKKLSENNNSVLVVEHDPDFIRSADTIIEIGPAAGSAGGEILYAGAVEHWQNDSRLILTRKNRKQSISKKNALRITNATARNLKDISCSIPLNALTVLSGVSGSGKSSLVSEVLLEAFRCYAQGSPATLVPGTVTGFERIHDCMYIDQSPLAKSPRANVATYSKIWDTLRALLADTEAAQQRALTRSAFSFNVDQGRCPACAGSGYIKEDMQFLSDVYILCDTCLGRRFQDTILEVQFLDRNAYQWLQTTVDDTATLLAEHSKIRERCSLLQQVGLGHLTLGHALADLSGGEAQRLKLVRYIDSSDTRPSLLIFDEPTTGLHTQDVGQLLDLFDTLKQSGHTLVCIEHNLDVISAADWILDLGPEGGYKGGELLFEGTVANLKRSKRSETAQFLRGMNDPEARSGGRRPANENTASDAATRIEGARQHNLKNVSLDIPLEKIVAFTGVSGSGKSSIARDILFAEGQRRYLDCLSPYARQFIKGLDRPVVDSVENIPPSVYIGQHVSLPLQLSTIATLSEIYNFLRLFFVKVGNQYCPDHPDRRIAALSAEDIAAELREQYDFRIKILAPVIVSKKGTHKEVFARALSAEISEVRTDGFFCKPSSVASGLERNKVHSIEYVIAACNPTAVDRDILTEAVAHALALGSGSVIVVADDTEQVYSSTRACPECKRGFFKPDPEDLSFNSKRGACPACEGSGKNKKGGRCTKCNGERLTPIGRHIRVNGKNISQLVAHSPSEIQAFLSATPLAPEKRSVAQSVLHEVHTKLDTLISLGLDHLTLDRDCRTLSGGELQRVRLTAALGSSLSGVLYLLDEPSAGLHPDDNRLVLDKVKMLRDNGNSVVIIEHDPESIRIAEHVVELGPGGGKDGGTVVFNGPMDSFLKQDSRTAQALNAHNAVSSVRSPASSGMLEIISGAHNTVTVSNLALPLQQLVVFCGVSGAGKSSLVHGIIADTLLDGLPQTTESYWKSARGTLRATADIEKILLIDQQPIGKNSRSTPASYLSIWDHIRKLYAQTAEAKSLGWTGSFFSYNTGKGRCPACEGRGELKLEMNFLANAAITCDTCEGRRFSDEANSIRYLGLSIADSLALTFDEAKTHFANHPKIRKPLDRACALGLGYLTLGQSSATLSGGEAQRLKLVAELNTRQSAHTLYILDEPTTGLHVDDVSKLLAVLRELVDLGNSVFVIEHDPCVLLAADHVVELGPGPGIHGGRILFQGPPASLKGKKTPWGALLAQ